MNPAGRMPHVENVWAGRDLLVGDWLNISHPSVPSQLLVDFPRSLDRRASSALAHLHSLTHNILQTSCRLSLLRTHNVDNHMQVQR